jgi:hypothetical protein
VQHAACSQRRIDLFARNRNRMRVRFKNHRRP